jgi:hypothetical protein
VPEIRKKGGDFFNTENKSNAGRGSHMPQTCMLKIRDLLARQIRNLH